MGIVSLTPEHAPWVAEALSQGFMPEELPGSDEYVIEDSAGLPVALMNVKASPQALEPHIQWFPWATCRRKYQGFLDALGYLRRINNILIMTRKAFAHWFDAWAKRGFIRKVGVLTNMGFDGEIHIYQAVKCSKI